MRKMKKLLNLSILRKASLFGAAAVIVLSCNAYAANPENLMINGDFENELGSLGEAWVGYWNPVKLTRVESEGEAAAKHGSYFLKISGRNAASVCVTQELKLKKGITYTVSAWVRMPDGADEHNFKLMFRLPKEVTGKDNEYLKLQTITATGSEWVEIKSEYTPPIDMNAKFMVIDDEGSYTSTYYIDDFIVTSDYLSDADISISGTDSVILGESGVKTADYRPLVKYNGESIPEDYDTVWSVSDNELSIDNGVLTIPENYATEESGTRIVTITAEITDFGITRRIEKRVEVRPYESPQRIVSKEAAELCAEDVSDEPLDCITKNLNLRSVGRYGANISWKSSLPDILSDAGEILQNDGDWHRITLSAAIEFENASAERSFELILSGRDNLVINGDFEYGFEGRDTLVRNSYSSGKLWYANWAKAERLAGEGTDGSFGVRVSGRDQRSQGLEQTVMLKAGRTYTISADIRMPDGADKHTFILSADTDGNKLAEVTAESGKWVTLTCTKKCTSDESFTMRIYDGDNNVAKEFYIDNYSVTYDSLTSAQINMKSSLRKPESGERTVECTLTALTKSGKAVTPDVTWSIENETSDAALEGNALKITESTSCGSVILHATAESDGKIITASKRIEIKEYLDEAEIVNEALEKITWSTISNEKADSVTENLNELPSEIIIVYKNNTYAVSAAWSSSDAVVLSDSGLITRNYAEDKTVKLTVEFSFGEAEIKKEFAFTVKKLENLADNPGFEGENANWSLGEITSEISRSGKNGYRAADKAMLANSFITDGHLYYIGGYVYSENGGSIAVTDDADTELVKKSAVNTKKWTEFCGDFTARNAGKAISFTFISDGVFYLDDIVIKDITTDYSEALKLCSEAETKKSSEAVKSARESAAKLPGCPRKTALISRIDAIKVSSSGSSGGGGGKGGSTTGFSSSIVKGTAGSDKSKNFTDVSGHWAYDDIQYLFEKGIVNGKSNDLFCPEDFVTRAEFAALLVRTANLSSAQGNSFDDVDPGEWYAQPVSAAADSGIIFGNGGFFRPNDNISREEAAAMLMRVCRAKDINMPQGNHSFADSSEISSWAADDINAASALNIIRGMSDGSFMPKKPLTRAESAAVIKRLYGLINE